MDIYDESWFKERAKNCIQKIEEGVWDYSDSLLLYTASGSEEYENMQQADTPYNKLVTKPERDYLQKIAKDIAETLPDYFEYIDLGPGTEHKEQFLFDELKKQGKTFVYVPVDIDNHFLSKAKEHAESQGIEVKPMKCSFEELPEKLGETDIPRFASLGLTFSNYNPEEALSMLESIVGKNGYYFFDCHMRERTDMNELRRVYMEDAKGIVFSKAQLIGLDTDTDMSAPEVDYGFRVWSTVLRSNEILESLGISVGDKMLTFQSLRYTPSEIVELLGGRNYVALDTSEPFVGYIIST